MLIPLTNYFMIFAWKHLDVCNACVTFVLSDNKVLYIMKYSELYRMLEADGWYLKSTKKHHKYVHPTKPGFIPVGKHVSQEVPKGTLNSILSKAGLK